MRKAPMCFSIFQVPRYKIHTLTNIWESFHSLSRNYGNCSRFGLLSSNASGIEGGYSKRWTRRPVTTKTEGNKTTQSSKPSQINDESFCSKILTSTAIDVNKTEINEIQRTQYFDIRQKIAEDKEFAKLVTFIGFDIETTGFSRERDRIIEIALLDHQEGKNSMFQTLVNPDRNVPNAHVHGISNHMVRRPDVPRMKELIPILKQFVKSREKPGGFVVLVAHNARTFDVPFLAKEFSRSSQEIPPNWLFLDTLPLAREMMKSGGLKLSTGLSLQSLREYYSIPLAGSAHRAMSDVKVLSLILPRLTFDLKLSVSGLVQKTFAASDLNTGKKKKKQHRIVQKQTPPPQKPLLLLQKVLLPKSIMMMIMVMIVTLVLLIITKD